ncbi:MAG: lipoate--protein ligase family protein [Lachnospiraceae bacterium]|nr:lipoate--protein ligase family protein [Lachnospiraceae bacterium]
MIFKIFQAESFDPIINLKKEEELEKQVQIGIGVLYLWQNDNTIVIGRNQDPEAECKVLEFQAQGGVIVKRRSGGGAVYHDRGNLNFSLICHESDKEFCEYTKILEAVIARLGMKAEFNGRNDLLINGRKFSGNAVYRHDDIICQHGTILVDTDIAKMETYLTPDISKLNRNGISSVKARVINLREVDEKITVELVKDAFIYEIKSMEEGKSN